MRSFSGASSGSCASGKRSPDSRSGLIVSRPEFLDRPTYGLNNEGFPLRGGHDIEGGMWGGLAVRLMVGGRILPEIMR